MKKLLLIALLAISFQAMSQTDRVAMERERAAIQQEMKELQSSMSKVKGQKKETLAKLALLQRKLDLQNRMIGSINKEIRIINDDIYTNNVEIYRLQKQLDTLKKEYSRSVVNAYKSKNNYQYINFIFSANSFNDAWRRVSYLKAYRKFRENQVRVITDKEAQIQEHKRVLLSRQNQKQSALQNQQQQMAAIAVQKKEKDAVVAKLKSEERNLSKEIATKKKRDKILKNQITAIVRREIEKAKKEEAARIAAARKAEGPASPSTSTATTKKTATKKTESFLTLNEGQRVLASSFERNRGSLPWPVDNGVVSIPFGTSRVDGLTMDNPGITISTPSVGTTVKSVFDGEVSAVSNTGEGMMVMIRHGKYFTVYSNLSGALVSRGDQVRTGQPIGRAAEGDDGSGGQVDFMLMIESQNVNPSGWLKR